jgi:hypothetical protein
MIRKCLAALSLSVLLAGCAGGSLPSAEQVQLYLPENIRKCPNLPAPPKAQTNRATAGYIIRLHTAAKACGANMATVDRIYRQYRTQLQRIAKTGK